MSKKIEVTVYSYNELENIVKENLISKYLPIVKEEEFHFKSEFLLKHTFNSLEAQGFKNIDYKWDETGGSLTGSLSLNDLIFNLNEELIDKKIVPFVEFISYDLLTFIKKNKDTLDVDFKIERFSNIVYNEKNLKVESMINYCEDHIKVIVEDNVNKLSYVILEYFKTYSKILFKNLVNINDSITKETIENYIIELNRFYLKNGTLIIEE
jgi:hypothetical protein